MTGPTGIFGPRNTLFGPSDFNMCILLPNDWSVQGLPGPRNTLFGPSDIYLDWSKSSGPSGFGPKNTLTPIINAPYIRPVFNYFEM